MCSIDGCEARVHGNGLCKKHWQQASRAKGKPCKQDGCGKPAFCKGLCSVHYEHQRKATGTKCKLDGCDEAVHGHGYCMNHYLQMRRRKWLDFKPCSIEGCERVAEVAGLCCAHHFRIAKYGDPDFRKRIGNGEQTPEIKKATAKKCQTAYRQTPHGKLRLSIKDAKRRLRDGTEFASITREQSAALWATEICQLCGLPMSDEDKSLDHKTPLSLGGSNDFENLQIAHLRCNQLKGNRTDAANLPF